MLIKVIRLSPWNYYDLNTESANRTKRGYGLLSISIASFCM